MLQNPNKSHTFLFNTLNMIYKTAYRENATDTGAMVDKTAMLLRLCFVDKANRNE
ncbi:MAG: histidine kinase [Thomasclavelia sp.]